MDAPAPTLDKREPRGIIIRTGAPRRTGAPFWAYFWSEDAKPGACAGPNRSRILDAALLSDLSSLERRASS